MAPRAMPAPPYSATTVAKWFVAWATENDAELSNLKLQKLLYYAQGYHLARFGTPLFRDGIQAWPHGPVVVNAYHAFKKFGSADLKLGDEDDFDWPQVDPDTTQFLIQIWDELGSLAAWRLRDMTHSEAPWKEYFEDGVRHLEIPHSALIKFFKPLTSARP